MLTSIQETAVEQIASASVIAEESTGCPAELTAAQAILESAYLTEMPQESNNPFGIKATDTHETYSLTEEYLDGQWKRMPQAFECYPTLAAAFIAHAKLIQGGRYSDAWRQYEQDRDLDGLIRGVCGIYATDPDYTGKILTLAHGPNVAEAIQKARTETALD